MPGSANVDREEMRRMLKEKYNLKTREDDGVDYEAPDAKSTQERWDAMKAEAAAIREELNKRGV